MNSPIQSAPDETPANGADRAGNVDKIRDILFGSQMRDYDKKFARLEERLLKEAASLREDLKRRFDSLESFMKREVEALGDAIKAEKGERLDAQKAVGDKLADHAQAVERKAAQADEQAAKAHRDLRQLVLDETKRLAEEISQRHSNIAADLGRESQEIRGMLTDRYALSDLFAELSLRLKNELKLPVE
jgi:hypothetical protein